MAKKPWRMSSRKFSAAFNRVVRRHRLAQDLSQEALSERADVDRTYVGLLERGQRGPGLNVAKRLADALGYPLTELVAEAEEEWRQDRTHERKAEVARAAASGRKRARAGSPSTRQTPGAAVPRS